LSLSDIIQLTFENKEFTLNEVYKAIPDKPKTTIRGRIYDNLGVKFNRVGKGVYRVLKGDNQCLLIEGDGRDLGMLENNSIDCIITDHPWEDPKSNIGGDRKFTNEYSCFKYSIEDFREKYRVLKEGSFLVEILPAENENNFEYLYEIKKMAHECGLLYYAKIPWKKGKFVSNTGRKAKNTEDVMIFSKGKARSLRIDVKKSKASGVMHYMSGSSGMLPTMFDIEAVPRKKKVHQSEKPVQLFEEIMEYLTLPNDVILDQFAGSGAVGEAALSRNRSCILIELLKENVQKIANRLNCMSVQFERS
jgi:site-specific DNA-methyltransferase (adenine-specific)